MKEAINLNLSESGALDITQYLQSKAGARRRQYRKGEVISRSDQNSDSSSADCLYYSEQGFVLSYSLSRYGHRVIHGLSRAYAVFPYASPISNHINTHYLPERTIYFEAATAVSAWYIPQPRLHDFLTSNLNASRLVSEQLNCNHRLYMALLEAMQMKQVTQQVESLLLMLAAQFGIPHNEGVQLEAPLTHQIVGDALSIARETASRCLMRLRRRGLITYEGHYIVLTNTSRMLSDISD